MVYRITPIELINYAVFQDDLESNRVVRVSPDEHIFILVCSVAKCRSQADVFIGRRNVSLQHFIPYFWVSIRL